MVPEVRLLVQRGVGVVVEAETAAVGAVVDVDGQLVDRAGGQVVRGGRDAREVQAVVEGHDVDQRPDQRPVGAEQAQVTADVLVAVALVAAGRADAEDDLAGQFGEGGARAGGQPQRQHVHDHAGDAQRHRAHAAHHRQPEDDLFGAGGPGQVQRLGGDQHVGPGGADRGGQFLEPLGDLGPQVRGAAQMRTGGQGGAPGQVDGLGPVRERLVPVLPVGLVRVRGAVRGVVGDQVGEAPEGVGAHGFAGRERRVDLGGAAGQQRVAEAVHDDVVDALVPQPAGVADPEQRVREQRPGGQVERFGQVGVHPGARRAVRVGLRAQVRQMERQRRRAGGQRELTGALGRLDDTDAQRVGLGDHLVQRVGEQRRVHRAVDLQVLGGVLRGARRIQGLGVPQAGLGGRQRQPLGGDVPAVRGGVQQRRHESAPRMRAHASMAGCSARSTKPARVP